MGRHAMPDPEPVRGRAAIVQWLMLIVCGLLAVGFGAMSVAAIVALCRDWEFDDYGVPGGLSLGFTILFAQLALHRVYRLTGRQIPEGSGGSGYV